MVPSLPRRHQAELEIWMEELARRQHGVVSRAQLLERGATTTWVDGRVRSRRLRPLYRGVYQVGPLRAEHTRFMAALLAAGSGAAIAYWSSATLWVFAPDVPAAAPVQVLVVGSDRGRRAGLRPHRVETLSPDEVTVLHGIRLTTPSRTLVDLAGCSTLRQLMQALARAERRGLLDRKDLFQVMARHRTRRGVGRLKRFLEEGEEPGFTRSEAEERFLKLVHRAELPKPGVNVVLEGMEVDFLWREARLVVEVDGYAFHSSKRAFETDRRRDAELTAAGFRILRVTWRQLEEASEAVIARLARALANSARPQDRERSPGSRRPGRSRDRP